MTMQDKIQELLVEKKMSNLELSRKSGVPNSTLAAILKGVTNRVSINAIIAIAKALECTADYLINDESNYKFEGEQHLVNHDEYGFIKKYRILDERGKDTVNTILYFEYKRMDNHAVAEVAINEIESYKSQNHDINLYYMPASAGTGTFLDSDDYEIISVGNEVPLTASFGVRISGDSMEPKYPDGHIAWVKMSPTVEEGNVGVFVVNGEGYIKKQGHNELISLNPAYQPIKINEFDEVRTYGEVIAVTENKYEKNTIAKQKDATKLYELQIAAHGEGIQSAVVTQEQKDESMAILRKMKQEQKAKKQKRKEKSEQ